MLFARCDHKATIFCEYAPENVNSAISFTSAPATVGHAGAPDQPTVLDDFDAHFGVGGSVKHTSESLLTTG